MGKDLITLQGTYQIKEVVQQNFGDIWRVNSRVSETGSTPADTGVRYFGANTLSVWDDRAGEAGTDIRRMIVLGSLQRDGSSFTSDWEKATYIAVRLHNTENDWVGTGYFQMADTLIEVGTDAQMNSLQARNIIQTRLTGRFSDIVGQMWRQQDNPGSDYRRVYLQSTDINVAWCIVNEGTLYANQPWDLTQDKPNAAALEPLTAWAKVTFAPLAVSVGSGVALRTGSRDLVILRVPWNPQVFEYTRVLFRDIVYNIKHFTERPYREIEMVLDSA